MWWILPLVLGLTRETPGISAPGQPGQIYTPGKVFSPIAVTAGGTGGITIPSSTIPKSAPIAVSPAEAQRSGYSAPGVTPAGQGAEQYKGVGQKTGKVYDFTNLVARRQVEIEQMKAHAEATRLETPAQRQAREDAIKAAALAKSQKQYQELLNSSDPMWRAAARAGSMSIESMRGYESGRALLARFGY